MVVLFVPARLLGQYAFGVLQSPFATDLFLSFGSTGSKQTLNGLFYVYFRSKNLKRVNVRALFAVGISTD